MLEKKVVSQCISSDYCRGWNDAVDAMPRWISVEERWPGAELLGKYIIICIKNRWNERRVDTVHWWGPEQMHGAAWFWSDVTHWMPLPEPPEVEG